MSSDLVWQVIRNNSSFIRSSRGIQKKFSVEPFNLKAVNSRIYNGLVNKKSIDIQPSADKKTLVVSTKTTNRRRPAKSVQKVTLKRRGARATIKAVKNIASNQNPRFAMVAARRASQLLRSLKRANAKKTA